MGDIDPKPAHVELDDDEVWSELTPFQRWYRKNRDSHIDDVHDRRDNLKEFVQKEKADQECERCGFDEHPAALDFHHSGEKVDDISRMARRGFSKETIREEMEKCEILCANCHRILHA